MRRENSQSPVHTYHYANVYRDRKGSLYTGYMFPTREEANDAYKDARDIWIPEGDERVGLNGFLIRAGEYALIKGHHPDCSRDECVTECPIREYEDEEGDE